MSGHPLWAWALFLVFIGAMLLLDLGLFNKKDHEIKLKEALGWSLFWIALSLVFCGGLYYLEGQQAASEFLTAYVLEKSLSVDNLFVFIVIFSYFKVPESYRHRVLYWGILGAIAMRAVLITVGVTALVYFHWLTYVFGALLLWSAWKLAAHDEDDAVNPEDNAALKFMKRYFPFTTTFENHDFFTKKTVNGKLMTYATPMFATLVVIEMSDLMFAVDSIPAVLAVSKDSFIVFTSNIFAILGLRSLYFALEGLMPMFHYLKKALVLVLGFIGVKMLIADYQHIPTTISLAVVGTLLVGSVALSIAFPPKKEEPTVPPKAA